MEPWACINHPWQFPETSTHKTHPAKQDPRTSPFGPFYTPRISLNALSTKALKFPAHTVLSPNLGELGAKSVPLSFWSGAGSIQDQHMELSSAALGDPLANI